MRPFAMENTKLRERVTDIPQNCTNCLYPLSKECKDFTKKKSRIICKVCCTNCRIENYRNPWIPTFHAAAYLSKPVYTRYHSLIQKVPQIGVQLYQQKWRDCWRLERIHSIRPIEHSTAVAEWFMAFPPIATAVSSKPCMFEDRCGNEFESHL